MREQPTARQVVEAMLRDSADAVTDPEAPRGCLVVLAATNTADEGVREFLAARRRKDHALVEQRLERGVAEGDLPASTDTAAMTTFLMTIQQGLSLQARDGRSRAELHAVVDRAMCAWDSLV